MSDTQMVNSGYDRVPLDYYPTPAWITELVCDYANDHWPDYDNILEPACGEGHMAKVMEGRGFTVDSYDLVNRGYGLAGVNFLENDYDMAKYDGLVTNPPYGKMASAFIRRGLDLIEGHDCFMAMVLRNEFDCAKGMMELFEESPLYYGKLVLTKRPLWVEPQPGEKSGSPRHNYAVYFWQGRGKIPGIPTPFLQYAHPDKGYNALWI